MKTRDTLICTGLAAVALFWGTGQAYAQAPRGSFYANSDKLTKFVDGLPGLTAANVNNLGQYIPLAVRADWVDPNGVTHTDQDYYELGIVEYTEKMHSELPKATRLRGYVQVYPPGTTPQPAGSVQLFYPAIGTNAAQPILFNGQPVYAYDKPHYLGPTIVATKDRPVRIKYYNLLPLGAAGNLFIPVDTTYMGAGTGPNGTAELYKQNRAEIHLHGGLTPWVSDGTPHQWITPAGEITSYPTGASFENVPDMMLPPGGAATLYYPNQQSFRLMFYHDHAYGMTRLNVYCGEAAGYVLTDPIEQTLINGGSITYSNSRAAAPTIVAVPPGTVPDLGIPLVIQDKTFVPTDVAWQDAKWQTNLWGLPGDLWFPHVYEPNQDPNSADGTNPSGRWDYGPWFWPIFPVLNPVLPDPSGVPEAFMDTPVVNGTAYPTVTLEPKAYRFRILNACNDRFLNLQLYVADATGTEVKMVPAIPHDATTTPKLDPGVAPDPVTGLPKGYWPTTWPTDGRDGGVPDPATAGPKFIQIGTEGGILPAPAVIPTTPIGYEYFRRSVTVLNVLDHSLFLGPAERADVIVDFSAYAGQTLIVYNDAPAPVPAFDARIDYYTGDVDQTANGGAATTLAGKGPNTRTIMQIKVAAGVASAGSAVGSVTVNSGGAGYVDPVVYIDPPPAGVQATATATVSSGGVTGIALIAPTFGGAGYTAPVITIDPPVSGVQATATASLDIYGDITNITILNPGSNYTSIPNVTITDPAGLPYVAYWPASVAAAIAPAGVITAITVTAPGSGYAVNPVVTITNATAPAATPAIAKANLVGISGTPFNAAPLTAALAAGFAASQDPPIIPYPGYEAAFPPPAIYGTNVWTNHYFHIFDGAANYPTFTFWDVNGVSNNLPILNKGIQELFEPVYGRMNAIMAAELPFTTALNQTTLPLAYVDPVTETVPEGETQIWKITHNGVDTHAVHFHLVNVQVMNRIGWDGTIKPPNDNELGWKETVRMNPLEDIIVAARGKAPKLPFGQPNSARLMDVTSPVGSTLAFTQVNPATGTPMVVTNAVADFGHEYVWHCHLLGHEENDMMRPIKFVVGSTVPDAPSGLTATTNGINAAILTWTDPTPPIPANLGLPKNEIGFQIWRATVNPNNGKPGPYAQIGSAPANARTFTDPTASGATYNYYVVAYNAAGSSPPSGLAQIVAGGPPSAPLNLTGAVTGPTQVTLTFTDTALTEFGFVVERSTDGGLTFPVTFTLGPNPGQGTATFADNTTAVAQNYVYRVYAFAGTLPQLNSPYSNLATVSTALLAPTGLTATIQNATQVRLNWVDNAANNTAYLVERSADNGATWATLSSTVGANATSYTDGTAVSPNTYTYRVTATSGAVVSPSATVSLIFAAPVTPTGLTFVSIARIGTTANDSVTLSWTAVGNAASYTITRATSATFTTGLNTTTGIVGPTSTALTVPRGTPGVTRYWFRIQAVNPVGTSAPSAGVGPVTTL